MLGPRGVWGRIGRPRMPALLARVMAVVIVLTGALESAVVPAYATSISEFSTGITSPGG